MTEIQIPPTPANVSDAKRQANDLAYGFEKHTGDYWNDLYRQDPDYAWKRMLGWQAGGDDVARFGLYADPPSPWHGTPVDPPVPPVPVPDDLTVRLDRLDAAVKEVKGLLISYAERPPAGYEGWAKVPYLGNAPITLTPTKP